MPNATSSWRDTLPIHPAAELFPMSPPDELKVIGADIKKNKLTSPIVLIRVGDGEVMLLDGRSRLDAIEACCGPARVVEEPIYARSSTKIWTIRAGDFTSDKVSVLDGYDDIDPSAYVVSANIRRRHLTAGQKDEVIAKLLKADPTKSNRQVAKTVGVSHPHVAGVRAELEKSGDVETVTTSIDTKGRAQPTQEAKAPRHRRLPCREAGKDGGNQTADQRPCSDRGGRSGRGARHQNQTQN